jgi:hypothetical protein
LTNHVITKDYKQLKGFSTASIFKRPAFVAETAVNIQRNPDDSFGPRRGYQYQTAGIGGLGCGFFKNIVSGQVQDICISSDGNLYKKTTGTLTITFTGATPSEYVAYEIYVDPTVSSDNQNKRFDPFSVIAQAALVTDSINFLFGKVTAHLGEAVGTGSTTYTGTLPGAPLGPGQIKMTDGTLTIYDQPLNTKAGDIGTFFGDVGVGTNVINYTTGDYTVTFSGVTGAVTADYESALTTVFNQAMGKGYGVGSPYLISTLITELIAVPGVSVTSTGDTAQPGAFLTVTEMSIIADGVSVVLEYFYWEAVNRTVGVTFPGLLASLDTEDFRIATFAPFQDLVYIGSAFDDPQKYDGQTVYRAGMPNGVPVALANMGGGNVNAGTHTYYMTYEQIDATGRLVQGVISDGVDITLGGNSIVGVTVDNLVDGSGWNTNGAIINGAQGPTNTINVDPNPTLRVGDSAFFLDTSGVEHVRNVTAVTNTTITIDGAPVSVTDATPWQEPISNNLRITIYRTLIGGTEPFFVFTIPNNSEAATTQYQDNVADSTLFQQYIFPVNRRDPPPRAAIVFPFQSIMIYTADPLNDDTVWYSDPNEPEYVDQLRSPTNEPNRFLVPPNADDITGVGISGSTLVIFKKNSIYAISGDIATEQYTVVGVADGTNVGCIAHSSIASASGLLYFLDENSGVYCMAENTIFPTDANGTPIAISTPIDAIFRDNQRQDSPSRKFHLTRAVGINYSKDNQYLLFLPAETPCGCPVNIGPRAANENSVILAYDYQGKNWFTWTNMNAAGGMYVINDNLYWQERRLSQTGGITSNTAKQHREYELFDYADHVCPIRTTWVSSWEDYGQPRVRKKFIRAAMLFDNVTSMFKVNAPEIFFFSAINWISGMNAGIYSTQSVITPKIEANPWDISDWDWTTWSGYQDTFVTINLKGGTVAKSIQIGLQLNQLNTTFSLQGFQLELSPDFGRTIVR